MTTCRTTSCAQQYLVGSRRLVFVSDDWAFSHSVCGTPCQLDDYRYGHDHNYDDDLAFSYDYFGHVYTDFVAVWTPWVYFDVRVNLGYCSDATTAVFVKDSVAPAACSPTARHVRRGAWQHYFNSAFLVIFVCVQHQCWCRLLLQPRGRQLRIRELRRRPRQRQRRRR